MNNASQINRSAPLRAARAFVLTVSAVVAAATQSGCVALAVGGAVGTALVVTDRRTAGVQLEDQNIELKSLTRIREAVRVPVRNQKSEKSELRNQQSINQLVDRRAGLQRQVAVTREH